MGHIDRKAVNELYGQAVAGLVLLLPTANYMNSLPIKMFEYMAAGIPFVASDFPLWREIVSACQCGFCVPVNNKKKIQQSITCLLSNRKDAERMGRNGRRAVERLYNWNIEGTKLIGLYESMNCDQKEIGLR